MRPLRAALVAVLIALALPVSPASAASSTVTVSGRVLDDAGHPVKGASVLFRSRTAFTPRHWDTFFDGLDCFFSALFSVSPCGVPPEKPTPREARAKTDANGRYALRVRLDWWVGDDGDHDLEITAPGGGSAGPASTTTIVPFHRKNTTLPTLRIWGHAASIDPVTPTHRRLHAQPLSGPYGKADGDPIVYLQQGGDLAWWFGEVSDDRLVDERLVELGTTAIRARGEADLGSLHVTYVSTAEPVTSTRRPVSRGAKCAVYVDASHTKPVKGCPYTDGRLGTLPKPRPSAGVLLVDLGGPQVVDAYVVRGCTLTSVAGSVDGTTYVTYPTSTLLGDGTVRSLPLPARYVRLDVGRCVPAEVSVFGEV